jgi:trans-aconitate methyltransferase
MPTMSRSHGAFCRSAPWRALAGNVVLPWSLLGFELHGDVLEIGAGSGAMAAQVLARYDQPMMTVTDFDEAMVAILTPSLAGLVVRFLLRKRATALGGHA